MNTVPVNKIQLVEVQLPGTAASPNAQTSINFPTQQNLWGKAIISIETFTVSDVPLTLTNFNVVTYAQLAKAYLYLYMNNPDVPGSDQGQYIQSPLVAFHYMQNDGGTGNTPEPFNRGVKIFPKVTVIQWEKSVINLSAALNNTDNRSFYFAVNYRDLTEQERKTYLKA